MEVVPLTSGVEGEEAHQEYKEGDGSHRRRIGSIFFYGLLILEALFSCLANIVVLFSTRVFSSGNPTFILKGL